ncbi:hypothetical protein LZL87_002903 [Fusarium oxysporum]|nr:hypothetical protein LZL87_002903 [Fusarium oxysporum]
MSTAALTSAVSEVNSFDEDDRWAWIVDYLKEDGRYFEDKLHETYKESTDRVAKRVHDQGATQVGHLFFEFMVDETFWTLAFQDVGRLGNAPNWPWPERPTHRDMSQGLSLRYRQWRIDNNLSIDTAEFIAPVPLCTIAQPSLAKRQEIWEDIYGDKPYNEVVVGPFELGLPRDLDFHHLALGEGNEVYDKLRGLISPATALTWTTVDGKAASLIVGVDPKYEACNHYPYVRMEVRRLWLQICLWLKTVKQGNKVTVADHLANAVNSERSLARFDTFDV